jgi:hypothetical protein
MIKNPGGNKFKKIVTGFATGAAIVAGANVLAPKEVVAKDLPKISVEDKKEDALTLKRILEKNNLTLPKEIESDKKAMELAGRYLKILKMEGNTIFPIFFKKNFHYFVENMSNPYFLELIEYSLSPEMIEQTKDKHNLADLLTVNFNKSLTKENLEVAKRELIKSPEVKTGVDVSAVFNQELRNANESLQKKVADLLGYESDSFRTIHFELNYLFVFNRQGMSMEERLSHLKKLDDFVTVNPDVFKIFATKIDDKFILNKRIFEFLENGGYEIIKKVVVFSPEEIEYLFSKTQSGEKLRPGEALKNKLLYDKINRITDEYSFHFLANTYLNAEEREQIRIDKGELFGNLPRTQGPRDIFNTFSENELFRKVNVLKIYLRLVQDQDRSLSYESFFQKKIGSVSEIAVAVIEMVENDNFDDRFFTDEFILNLAKELSFGTSNFILQRGARDKLYRSLSKGVDDDALTQKVQRDDVRFTLNLYSKVFGTEELKKEFLKNFKKERSKEISYMYFQEFFRLLGNAEPNDLSLSWYFFEKLSEDLKLSNTDILDVFELNFKEIFEQDEESLKFIMDKAFKTWPDLKNNFMEILGKIVRTYDLKGDKAIKMDNLIKHFSK